MKDAFIYRRFEAAGSDLIGSDLPDFAATGFAAIPITVRKVAMAGAAL